MGKEKYGYFSYIVKYIFWNEEIAGNSEINRNNRNFGKGGISRVKRNQLSSMVYENWFLGYAKR